MDEIEDARIQPTGAIDEPNRRLENRLPFTGLRLKVRRRGMSRLRRYEECYSIDLSNSGLAFSSNTLQLSELEKVDFILTFQNQTIQGTALVRYIQAFEHHTQYGLMFIQALPELDMVLGADNLTTQEIKHLAGSMAEHLAYSIQEKKDGRLRIRRQRQQLCDALNAYFERLGQMGIRLPDVHHAGDRWTTADAAVKIDDKWGNIEFFHYVAETDEFIQESITTLMTDDNDTGTFEYTSIDGTKFKTLFEILSYISDEISLVAKLAHLYPE